ncbi:hypothetical protein MK805_09940 [Shimazuella sp. AN120528]|uniref:hypothetical protein n=1 Tax=Shimazuella soli TaxID=1892854 RepID=UPI001F0D66C8|nr:hypothetical protein [Shimazuella soli]MCH5585289.1 hypothetical protein [Shimazuella soli]
MEFLSAFNKLAGRCLTICDMRQILDEKESGNIQHLLQAWEEEGVLKKEPAIKHSNWSIFRKCNKCGAGASDIAVSDCVHCSNKTCFYCRRCLFYGRVKSCTPLFSFLPTTEGKQDFLIHANLPLTAVLQHTSGNLKSLYERTTKHIHAVLIPGSGELLILLDFLIYLLHKKKRIFWCQEKKKIAKTMDQLTLLMPKLVKYIDSQDTTLVLGTKWDLLTYNQQFDLVIWDGLVPEACHAWERSMAEKGRQLVIRTTLSKWDRNDVVHPVRLHRYPIPIPKFVQYRNLRKHIKRNKPIHPFHIFVEEVQALNGQALILVPTKEEVEVTLKWLQTVMPEVANKTCSILVENEESEELRILFSEQKFMFMLMPQQLMEKMQIANLHLCLLHADHPTFDRKRLVELTHFIGLNAYFPECEVLFIGEMNTEMIVQTKKEHIYLNELAKKEGYLQKEA